MKPIGILTFHRASNYGAVLQAYALQTAFSCMGSKAVIVDYYCPAVEEDHRPVGLFKHHAIPQAVMHYPVKARKDAMFNAFRDRKLVTSEPVRKEQIGQISGQYSLFVAGSDQVWSDRFSGFDPVYMMDFASPEQRYSYACSFGFDRFPQDKKERYETLLRGIRRISVREKSSAEMLEELGIDSRVDLDPTLLLDAETWRAFAEAGAADPVQDEEREKAGAELPPEDPESSAAEPYILVYTVNPPVHLLEYARALSARTGRKILYLNNQYKTNRDLKRIRFASPEEYVSRFANAEYVLTNSFHGTVFAILFHKKLKAEIETQKGLNGRSRDLLMSCGLGDCILTGAAEDEQFSVDWEEADRRLDGMREESLRYLREIAAEAERLSDPKQTEDPGGANKAPDPGRAKKVPDLCGDKSRCCGCAACYSACPAGAISMCADGEGFLYPRIDASLCVGCRKCERVCAFKGDAKARGNGEGTRVYACRNKDEEVLRHCSSGGLFTALSDVFLDRGDAVLCSAYDYEQRRTQFRLIRTREERDQCRGSMYMQSYVADAYKESLSWLRGHPGKKLLFVGTGCQAAGFRRYMEMQGETERVTVVDIICHGVASPLIWSEYAALLEEEGPLSGLNFKDKKFGWNNPRGVVFADGREISLRKYLKIYSDRLILRECCSSCPYTRIERSSDITIGDFWHLERSMPDFADERGTSLALLHSPKGKALFKSAKNSLEYRKSNTKDCLQMNLQRPTRHASGRTRFWKDHREYGIQFVMEKYGNVTLTGRVRRRTKKIAGGLKDRMARTGRRLRKRH